MGSSDIPPPDAPGWLIQAQTALLGIGVLFWDASYILMTRRSIETKSYGTPLLALAMNLSWEIVFVLYVCEMPLETAGFFFWLVLDLGLVYTTVKYGHEEWKHTNPWVGHNIGWILALMTAVGCVGQYAFCLWWFAEPGRGTGDKAGKWWGGREGFDTTEVAFWAAAAAQIVMSAGSLAMLLIRGHSGGVGYTIWFCRSMGTVFGLYFATGLLWWYWPSPHDYMCNPFALFLCGVSLASDIIYPFVLYRTRQTEVRLPDGRLIRADQQPTNTSGSHRHEKKA